MNTKNYAIAGGLWMIAAGAAFAYINTVLQKLNMNLGVASTTAAFFQYTIALLFLMPFLNRNVISQARGSKNRLLHFVRIFVSVIGIQLWTWALAHVPIWQGIALLMTSPLFATIGSGLFLREQVSIERWGATLVGFIGAMIILAPWSEAFSYYALLPIAAAVFWAAASLMAKYTLSNDDTPLTVIAYMLVLMLPFNIVFALPTFAMPETGNVWRLLFIAGALTAFAQWAIVKAYASADASYIQPFDHVKLPLNVLAGYLVFGYLPPGQLWLGAGLIIVAVSFITFREKN